MNSNSSISVQVDIVYSAEQVSKALQAILRHRIEAKLDHPSGTPRKGGVVKGEVMPMSEKE